MIGGELVLGQPAADKVVEQADFAQRSS